MAIATLDQWIASSKQQITLTKGPAVRTTIANIPFSLFEIQGQPGSGVLAGASTTAGVVPTDADAGFPLINSFGGGAGYLNNLVFSGGSACKFMFYDVLWKGGAYAFNANVTLSAQPSYSARVPNGTDYSNTEIWLETVTAFTGNQTITVTYTNGAGTTGRSTGAIATGVAPTLGRMLRLPLQAGDEGVQKIESVVSSVSTVGTFNVLVLRRLATGRIGNNGLLAMGPMDLGMPQIFDTSALGFLVTMDSTSSSNPEVFATIVSG